MTNRNKEIHLRGGGEEKLRKILIDPITQKKLAENYSLKYFDHILDLYLNDAYQKDKKNGYTLADDILKIREKYVYNLTEFANKEQKKSSLFDAMYNSSAKFIMVIINITF